MKKYLRIMEEFLLTHVRWDQRWRRLVTAMAMVAVFATTYALILPAITLEESQGRPEQGVYLDRSERGSTASLGDDKGSDVAAGLEETESGKKKAATSGDSSATGQKTSYANGIYTGQGDGYKLSLDLKEEMRLPADLTVSVEEVRENKENAAVYQSYLAAVKRAAARAGRGEIRSVRFLKFALYSDGKKVRTSQDIDLLVMPVEKDKVRKGDEAHVLTFRGSTASITEDLLTQMSGYRVSAYRFFYPSTTIDNKNWGLLCLAVTEPKPEEEEMQAGDSVLTASDGELSEEGTASTDSRASSEGTETVESAAEEKSGREVTATEEKSDRETDSTETATDAENGTEKTAAETSEDNRKPARQLEYQGEDFKVVMTCDDKAGIPEGAVLQVTEIRKDEDSEAYKEYLKEASETLEMNKMANPTARFFDIKIMDGEQEIEPKASVSVNIIYNQPMEVKEGEKVEALHFGEKETEVLEDVEVQTNKNDDVQSVTFDADSFSVYGVLTYTVDFTFDGYSYSIEGDSTVRLSRIVEVLGIAGKGKDYDTGMAFVKDVKEVTFTDESLVKVEKAGLFGTDVFSWGDWELTSLKPFDTEETLTVEMEDGIRYEIKVTDDQIKANVLTADGENYEITVTYGEDAKIPEGAELRVSEIIKEDKLYTEYYEEASKAVYGNRDKEAKKKENQESDRDSEKIKDKDFARFFDIEIRNGEEKIEPKADVTVSIKLADAPEDKKAQATVVHFAESGTEVMDLSETKEGEENKELTFKTDEFSVYSVIYTVDFHYEVNGKMYEFSIPGGGFVSLQQLVEVLGIADPDVYSENTLEGSDNSKVFSGEDDNYSTEEALDAEDGAYRADDKIDSADVGEEQGEDNRGTQTKTNLTLADVTISDATKAFVSDVEKVEFSNPELLWVGKAESDTNVGMLKETNRLECWNSEELTKEQLKEINAQTVEAGDWALISVLPFMSEETLTVTTKNGDQFEIRVTDAQDPSIFIGKEVIIYDNGEQRAMMSTDNTWDGYRNRLPSISLAEADRNTAAHWTVERNNNNYYLKSSNGKYLTINNRDVGLVDNWSRATPLGIQAGTNTDYRI